ncbi:MAG: hypothetical protein HUN04_19910 [Desulfobacter sp.]|nr:MAG: hypothetical protein HUN04_19910 [Desulfobacter sp.]
MVYYTKIDNQDYGLLIFKVIGAHSQKEADKLTAENWGETLIQGRTLEGPPTICPLFENLEDAKYNVTKM